MFISQIPLNKLKAFEHLVELKKQDKSTVCVSDNIFTYTDKHGKEISYIGFNTFSEYHASKYYRLQLVRVNGFYFVRIGG